MTSDVFLRDVTESDLPIFYEQQRDPAANQMAALPPREWKGFMAHWTKILADQSNVIQTVVFDGQVAGNVVSFEQGGEREVGYWLGRAYWGKGIATRALAAFLDIVKTRPLYAHVAKHNIASIRVLEKCGFKKYGMEILLPDKPGQEMVTEYILKLGMNEKYVAFLRAINVGGHTVKMEHLRRLFEAMGFRGVETFIASGNVIFEATAASPQALEEQIEAFLQASLGYGVATFIRTAAEVAAIASYQPFPAAELNAEGHRLYVAFLADAPGEEAQQKLMAFTSADDEFHVSGREVYWLCRQKMSESTFSGALLEKTLNRPATLRNMTTVKKIAAKYS